MQLARVQERGCDGAGGSGSWTIITTFLGLVFRVFLYSSIAVRSGHSILDSRFGSCILYFCCKGERGRASLVNGRENGPASESLRCRQSSMWMVFNRGSDYDRVFREVSLLRWLDRLL